MNQQGIKQVDPSAAWKALSSDPDALLIDVRTSAEWNEIGRPDLSSLGEGRIAFIEWQTKPAMAVNPLFASEASAAIEKAGAKTVYFICRSGVRSQHAGLLMSEQGTANGAVECVNVAEGFEGDPDAAGQRGRINGWQAHGLPWTRR